MAAEPLARKFGEAIYIDIGLFYDNAERPRACPMLVVIDVATSFGVGIPLRETFRRGGERAHPNPDEVLRAFQDVWLGWEPYPRAIHHDQDGAFVGSFASKP